MGSLAALAVYWTSPAALAILTGFAVVALWLAWAYRRSRRRILHRLRLIRAGTWLVVGFWTFVAASLLLCISLANPVEYGPTAVKVVAILSISLAVVTASIVAFAISRGTPAQVTEATPGSWATGGGDLKTLASRLALEHGLPTVRVRVVEGSPRALAEPPNTLVVSRGLFDLLSEEELEAVLLHELCHLVESDGPEKAFTGAMRRVLFFDPFVRLLDRASHREREHRADEWVAKRLGGGALASALVKIADVQPASGRDPHHPRIEDRIVRLRAMT